MKFSDKLSDFSTRLGSTTKSIVKILLQSRRSSVSVQQTALDGQSIVIMGNGPSLAELIKDHGSALSGCVTMALNFAANADEFIQLKPDFYLLADPHFFSGGADDRNVEKLYHRFNECVSWPMTLYVPVGHTRKSMGITNDNIRVENFNFVGVEGFKWFEKTMYDAGLGMPRPRNVLVPALMTALRAGFRKIYLAGADHGWLTTLDVTENNEVVSVQPHFYKDSEAEKKRVASVYKNVRLHEILLSFHLAFRSYHQVESYARSKGVAIYNSTQGSFIDAFERRPISEALSENI